MSSRMILLTILTAIWMSIQPSPVALAQVGEDVATPMIPSLAVQGSAEVRTEPDRATVALGVLNQEPTAAAAQDATNRVASRILEAVQELGVPVSAIRTSELQLSPVYASPSPRSERPEEPRIVAYQASNVVTVHLEELAKIGPVIDAGLEAGANRLDGVAFSLGEDLPHRNRALALAVREARAKAETMAEALEVRLVGILEASEGGISIDYPRPYLARGKMAFAEAAVDMAPTPVAPGEITVSATVTLRYAIDR